MQPDPTRRGSKAVQPVLRSVLQELLVVRDEFGSKAVQRSLVPRFEAEPKLGDDIGVQKLTPAGRHKSGLRISVERIEEPGPQRVSRLQMGASRQELSKVGES